MKDNVVSGRRRAVIVGVLILLAYGVLASTITQNRIVVMLADVMSGLAVVGIAVLMYPLFRDSHRRLSLSYLILKCIEGVLMVAGGLLFLRSSSQYLREVIYDEIHIFVFIAGAFVFYILLFQSEIVPRFISVWGAVGIIAVLTSTLLHLTHVDFPAIDYLLILVITNEVFLAVWLMARGFQASGTESTEAGTE